MFKILGISDSPTTCDCCGKTGLKRTVALEPLSGGPVHYYGVTCAAKAMRRPGSHITISALEAVRIARIEFYCQYYELSKARPTTPAFERANIASLRRACEHAGLPFDEIFTGKIAGLQYDQPFFLYEHKL